jgi:hypothetical protein
VSSRSGILKEPETAFSEYGFSKYGFLKYTIYSRLSLSAAVSASQNGQSRYRKLLYWAS